MNFSNYTSYDDEDFEIDRNFEYEDEQEEKETAESGSLGRVTKGTDNVIIPQRGLIEQPNTLEEWALLYAAYGWRVFPLKRDKTPYTANGFRDATTDAKQIRAWWSKWPDAGIGLPTGDNFSVLDFDLNLSGKKSGVPHPEVWDKYKDALACYPRVRTQNGYHVYFLPTYDDAGEVIGNKAGVGPESGEFTPKGKAKKACDWRGAGGYVVAPPSMHATGDGKYHWEVGMKDYPLSQAPQLVRDWIIKRKPERTQKQIVLPQATGQDVGDAQKTAYLRSAIDGKCKDMMSAGEGERNHTLFVKACEMYELLNGSLGQLPDALAFESALIDAARCAGLGDDEIANTLDSARKHVGVNSKEPEFKQSERVMSPGLSTDWVNPIPDAPETENEAKTPTDSDELKWDKLQGAGEMMAVLKKIGFSGYYNTLADRAVYMINGDEVELSDNGQIVAQIISRISKAGYIIGTGNQTICSLQNLMDGICRETERNPVSDYLNSLPLMSSTADAYAVWQDLAKIGGYNDPKYTGIILTEFVAAEYNRWMDPKKAKGQHWAVLIRGGQRGGKSGLFRWLTEGITDNSLFVEVTDASDDRAIVEKAQGNMFAELSEGCLMNKRDEASMKALLSMTEFSGRFAYGRKSKKVTVSWSYVITTNDSFILRDPTGASRYACLEFTPEVNRMTPIERSNKIAKKVMAYVEKNRDTLWSAAKTIAQCQETSLEAISDQHAGLADWLEAGREANRCVSRDEDFLCEFLDKKKYSQKQYFTIREAEDYVLKMRDETKDVRRADIRKTITSIMQRYTDWTFKSTLRENGVRVAQRVYVYEGKQEPNLSLIPKDIDEDIPWT